MKLRETEADFQSYVIGLARALGWTVAHFRPARTADGSWRTPVEADGAGFPDLVLVRERVVFAELKSDSGKLSDAQTAWIKNLIDAGAEAHIWRPVDRPDVEDALRWRAA